MSSSLSARLQPLPAPPADALLADVPLARTPFLDAVFAASPYLTDLVRRDPAAATAMLAAAPEAVLERLCAETAAAFSLESRSAVSQELRRLKANAALLIALCDLGRVWDVEAVTAALTRFADAALGAAVNWLLLEAARRGRFQLADPANPALACGYTVIAMGKHGAYELNYSSDIDLIVLFDGPQAPLKPGIEPSTFFVRLTKDLVALLQDIDEHGYVFRVDLRLRPDPRATQIAIAMDAAANYYESMGQNWERAAMIKARAAAGDIALGEEFLGRLKPYIWRKYLDFAAIADVQSLKRQIHAVKGHGTIAVHGHNVKLGRGGIREIEFFAQTQQLIAGGRNARLRGRGTLEMLDALAGAQWITPGTAQELKEAYRFLRRIEHRIQMVADEQAHLLPSDEAAFARFARFCGFADAGVFAAALRLTFETVQGHYARLFEDAVELSSGAGSLVFTGGEDDPETIETLSNMGFRHPGEVSATIRGWHFGRYNATRSGRAKELLTELMPKLLHALADTGEPDQAFLAFDRFLAGLPAGVQLFSMLKANPNLLDLIATILGAAPRLAEQLSRRPKVLDAVIDPNFFGPLPGEPEMRLACDEMIAADLPLDEAMDRARIAGRELQFRIGVRVLSETVSAEEAGRAFSSLADLLLQRLHAAVSADMAQRHGVIPGGCSAVIAMGKLGGQEMTAASDLDLILVYDHAEGAEMSDGARPLRVNQYYARLTQRLVAAISAPTSEGVLYEVDLRLRPSGNKGPVAASLESFRTYHRDSAWTWEKLALTRARVVAGDAGLASLLTSTIRDMLCVPRDPVQTRADVLEMRALMLRELGAATVWDIKRIRGGLIDIEFIAQFLQLIRAPENPLVLSQNTAQALAQLGEPQLQILREAATLYHRVTQVLRLCVEGPYDPATAPSGLNRIVASSAAAPGIAQAELLLAETQVRVAGLFRELVGAV